MADRDPNRCNFFQKKNGQYVGPTHQSFCAQVEALSQQLQLWGIQSGDRVGIFSPNCSEWVLADMAILSLGAVVVPLYPTLAAEEVRHIILDSETRLVFIHDAAQHATFNAANLPDEIQAISFTPIQGLQCLQTDYRDQSTVGSADFRTRVAQVPRDALASIVYTSGTTGQPKGVELTHGNFLSNVEDLMQIFKIDESDSVLSFLPLSHVFERTVGYYTLLGFCSTVYYAESIDTVSQNLAEVHPTILISVPRVYEKIQARILDQLNGIKRPVFNIAYAIGQKYQTTIAANQPVSPRLKVLHSIADFLVFKSVRRKTGGKLRFFVSGGAPLSAQLAQFFMNLGLLIVEGYGMTESAPIIACNRESEYQFGSVGKALPSVTARISDDGELCVKGPNVMRQYHNLPEETAEIIDADGWLHTGDIATIDDRGFIRIVDRKKELIVMSNGKKVPPQKIEALIKSSRLVSQVMVVGDNRNYLVALVVPEYDQLQKVMGGKSISPVESEMMAKMPETIQAIQSEIDRTLGDCANYEKIKKVIVIPEPFTTETGELTITLKLRRKFIAQKWATQIDELYSS